MELQEEEEEEADEGGKEDKAVKLPDERYKCFFLLILV